MARSAPAPHRARAGGVSGAGRLPLFPAQAAVRALFSGIGPNAIPIAVGGGLAVLGVWLLIEPDRRLARASFRRSHRAGDMRFTRVLLRGPAGFCAQMALFTRQIRHAPQSVRVRCARLR